MNLETCKMVTISTAHIKRETLRWIDSEHGSYAFPLPTYRKDRYGFFMYVTDDAFAEIKANTIYPKDFVDLVEFVHSLSDAEVICLDCDGPIYEDIPTYMSSYDTPADSDEITKTMIEKGFKNKVISIEDEHDGCTSLCCRIGEHAFYFIGMEDEDLSKEQFWENYTLTMAIDMLYYVLKSTKSAAENGIDYAEFNYYKAVLMENQHSNKDKYGIIKRKPISKLCYDLYKIEWKRSHMISAEREMDAAKNCFLEADNYTSYNDYIEDIGYDGELYVCYEEFCDAEYRDKEYIRSLLDNEELFAAYCADVDE